MFGSGLSDLTEVKGTGMNWWQQDAIYGWAKAVDCRLDRRGAIWQHHSEAKVKTSGSTVHHVLGRISAASPQVTNERTGDATGLHVKKAKGLQQAGGMMREARRDAALACFLSRPNGYVGPALTQGCLRFRWPRTR